MRKCPDQHHYLYLTSHIGYIEFNWANTDMMDCYHGGTPLHFYLSRTSNVDLDIVKRLVANPEMLLLTDRDEDSKCTPIHILMHNKSIGKMADVLQYLVELNPDPLQEQDNYGRIPLHVACGKTYIDTRTVQILLRTCVDTVYRRNDFNALPIHCLCEEEYSKESQMDDEVAVEILQLFLEAKPDLVTQTQINDGDELLPIQIAVGNKSSAFCKVLVDAYPESVRRLDNAGSLPFHDACYSGRPDTVEYLFGLYPESLHMRETIMGNCQFIVRSAFPIRILPKISSSCSIMTQNVHQNQQVITVLCLYILRVIVGTGRMRQSYFTISIQRLFSSEMNKADYQLILQDAVKNTCLSIQIPEECTMKGMKRGISKY